MPSSPLPFYSYVRDFNGLDHTLLIILRLYSIDIPLIYMIPLVDSLYINTTSDTNALLDPPTTSYHIHSFNLSINPEQLSLYYPLYPLSLYNLYNSTPEWSKPRERRWRGPSTCHGTSMVRALAQTTTSYCPDHELPRRHRWDTWGYEKVLLSRGREQACPELVETKTLI